MKSEYINLAEIDQGKTKILYQEIKAFLSDYMENLRGSDEIDGLVHSMVYPPNPLEKKIKIFRGEKGEVLGVRAIQFYNYLLEGKGCLIIRMQTVISRSFRGQALFADYLFYEALSCRLRYPKHTILCYIHCAVPSVYRSHTKFFPEVYPHEKLPINARVNALLKQIGCLQGDNVQPGHINNTFIVKHNLISDVAAKDIKPFQGNPDIDFYLRCNPYYRDGDTLLIAIPITFENLYHAISAYEIMMQKHASNTTSKPFFDIKPLIFPIQNKFSENSIFLSTDEYPEHYKLCKQWFDFQTVIKNAESTTT